VRGKKANKTPDNKMPDTDFRELSDFRATIEGFAARCAARRIAKNPALMDRLNEILARLTKAARRGDYRVFQETDRQLHEAIIGISSVPGLAPAWEIVWEKLGEFHRGAFDKGVPDPRIYIEDHEHLVKMLGTGDPVAAEDAMSNHIETTWVRTMSLNAGHEPLHMVVMHLKAYMQTSISIKDVAEHVAYTSPGNLSRLLRRQYGMGFRAYLQHLRMTKAAELLAKSSLPVTTIARRVGYRTLQLFAQHFSRHYHMRPREWRKEKNPRARPARKARR